MDSIVLRTARKEFDDIAEEYKKTLAELERPKDNEERIRSLRNRLRNYNKLLDRADRCRAALDQYQPVTPVEEEVKKLLLKSMNLVAMHMKVERDEGLQVLSTVSAHYP